MKAIILCAGLGERLRPLTYELPKPMIPIAGRPVLEYALNLLKKYGIKEIAINTSYLPQKIKDYFGNGEKFGVDIEYSFEPGLLGTSGALNNFRKFFDSKEPFLVFYGDNITDIDLKKMLEFHKQKKSFATLALRKKPVTKKPASLVFVDENLQINKLVEKPSDELFAELCKDYYLSNSGIYILNPGILKFIPEGFSDFAYDIFPKLLKEKLKMYGFMMDEYYFREIGKIEKYELAKNEMESGKIKLNL